MYDTTEIQAAIRENIAGLVAAIQTAEKAQPMTAYMQIDMAAVVDAFIDAVVEESDFHQSIENDDDRATDAEWTARRAMCSALTLWRIKEYGKTWRELRREQAAIAKEIQAEKVAA
jgi:hypothetical protein